MELATLRRCAELLCLTSSSVGWLERKKIKKIDLNKKNLILNQINLIFLIKFFFLNRQPWFLVQTSFSEVGFSNLYIKQISILRDISNCKPEELQKGVGLIGRTEGLEFIIYQVPPPKKMIIKGKQRKHTD